MPISKPDNNFAGNLLVLGFSLAGVAAALAAQKKGQNVVVCELLEDIPLRAMFAVKNPFDNSLIAGSMFEVMARKRFKSRGIQYLTDEFELVDWREAKDGLQLTLKALGSQPVVITSDSVIIAPNGVVPRSDHPCDWEKFVGLGVSESAWADGPFFSGKHICVQGNGSWAIDQACMLGQWASKVTLLSESKVFPKSTPKPPLAVGLEFHGDTRITGLAGQNQRLESVSVDESGSAKTIPCEALFLCPEPLMDWRVMGRNFSTHTLQGSNRVAFAGVANGVPFGSPSELYSSGIDACGRLSAKF